MLVLVLILVYVGHTPESALRAKRITKSVLQTPEQLERAVRDVILQAVEDNVTCIYNFLAI